ncbi:MAG: MOFRL family protein, partial [Candidatus Micrarchaeota archaeon]
PKISSFVLADNDFAVDCAADFLRCKGLNPLVVKNVSGEARIVGRNLASLVNDGVCFVAGGETTVTVKGSGTGGRNQELALSAAMQLWRGVLLSAGTDGIDGNSDAAGAIVDSQTTREGSGLEMRAKEYLARNDSNSFFAMLGVGLVKTGPTGTNVCDLIIGIP